MNDVDTGALGASGRFARMEAALDRIELKLDLKADVTRVAAVEAKQAAIEAMIAEYTSGRITTPLSDLYLQRFTALETSVEKLESSESNREAVATANKAAGDARYSSLMWLVGIAMVVNVLIAVGGVAGIV